jgi:hypothetical protein
MQQLADALDRPPVLRETTLARRLAAALGGVDLSPFRRSSSREQEMKKEKTSLKREVEDSEGESATSPKQLRLSIDN